MAKKSLVIKLQKLKKKQQKAFELGKKMEKGTRVYNRCRLCGRNRGYLRAFDMCRMCFRELANKGLINGIKKSSW